MAVLPRSSIKVLNQGDLSLLRKLWRFPEKL